MASNKVLGAIVAFLLIFVIYDRAAPKLHEEVKDTPRTKAIKSQIKADREDAGDDAPVGKTSSSSTAAAASGGASNELKDEVIKAVNAIKALNSDLRSDLKAMKSVIDGIPNGVKDHVRPIPPPPPHSPSSFQSDWAGFIAPTAEDEVKVKTCELKEDDGKKCRWVFKQYISSKLEEMWWADIDRIGSSPCKAAKREPFASLFSKYRDDSRNGRLTPDNKPLRSSCECEQSEKPVEFDKDVYSRYEYENSCTKEIQYTYIEPLAGILRHPEYCHNNDYIIKKDWMIVDQWHLHKNDHVDTKKRNFYFDAGASTWQSGGGGPSQSWFDAMYAQKCVDFDGYWMWEVKKWDPVRIYKELPQRVRPKYHWYDIPASTNKNDGDSPLYHMKDQAREDDFVLLKVDIDNNVIENAIIEALLADPSLMALVDEFFWEHHINMQPLSGCCWGNQAASETQRKSIGIFKKFRENGIRAHSWV